MQINFSNSYLELPDIFYDKKSPDQIKEPQLIVSNKDLLKEFKLYEKDILQNFLGKRENSVALNYAGHQFGHFVPQLGDGRAVMLGQVRDENDALFDIQLKGSGKTKFSRSGDGKYPLNSAIKEYIISEGLFYLGVPTTRSLCLIATNEPVFREKAESGAVLARVAKSHIRFGTFEYFYFRNDLKNIKILADFSIKNYYPKCAKEENTYLSFFKEVYERQIELVTSWMSFGFIHGVMNTDNCLISGEAIDFGPCAFMDEYKKDQSFSAIDRHGRYSYSNQKPIILWNLIRFAETILPLINSDIGKAVGEVNNIISGFASDFDEKYYAKMFKKVGLVKNDEKNRELVDEFLEILEKHNMDFTNSFRDLGEQINDRKIDGSNEFLNKFIINLRDKIMQEGGNTKNSQLQMNKSNPLYIPRNHLIKKISDAAIDDGDFSMLEDFLKIIQNPFGQQKVDGFYTDLAKEDERVENTFCGT